MTARLGALVALLAFSPGCFGAAYVAEDRVVFPIVFGNAELRTEAVCIAGGPVSEGLVGALTGIARGAIAVLTGRASDAERPVEQGTPRQPGCAGSLVEAGPIVEGSPADPDGAALRPPIADAAGRAAADVTGEALNSPGPND